MEIRKATSNDAEPVAQLWQELIQNHLEYDPHFEITPDAAAGFADHIRKASQEPTSLVGVAVADDRIVGFINASVLKRPPCFTVARQGQIWNLFVNADCRRQGVGKLLVGLASEFFRANGVEFADVRIASENATAIAFWESMGIDPYITVGKLKI